MKKLTLGSLFAGIGGFEISATWAGIEPIWSNEIDPWCCKVLRKNFNHEIIEKDIRNLFADSGHQRPQKHEKQTAGIKQCGEKRIYTKTEKEPIGRVDILTGGFP